MYYFRRQLQYTIKVDLMRDLNEFGQTNTHREVIVHSTATKYL